MSVLPSDYRSGAIDDDADQSAVSSSPKDRLIGATFAILAAVAMAGWLYLIAKALWASIDWLAF
jgi:hypothetical protein